jgi:hypothetical protein
MPVESRLALSASAVLFGLSGLAMLFAPDDAARLLGLAAGAVLVQVLGAALLGIATMNWTARGMRLGGIYGRAVTAGNQVHAFIGALVLARSLFPNGGPAAMWVLTAVYGLAAVYFSWLMFFSTGLRDGSS